MRRFYAPLHGATPVSQTYTYLQFPWPEGLRRPLPGQFLTVAVDSDPPTFLRRPFSLCSWDEENRLAGLLIQERGPASAALCRMRPGATLDLLGPRGFPFPYQHLTHDPRPYLLLGGGIGVGPLLFAAQYLSEKGAPFVICLGFREAAMIPHALLRPNWDMRLAAEAGASGMVRLGRVLDLAEEVATVPLREVWACGPLGMLRSVWEWARPRGLACSVLMEEVMGCAVGACQGCAVPVIDGRGYLRSCTEGPVFDASIVDWGALWT